MEESSPALERQAFLGLGALAAVVGGLLFAVAGTVRYTEAWIFLGTFFGASLAVTLYLMRRDPKLLERRVKAGPVAEQRPRQRLIQALASCAFLAIIAAPALDHRLGWSRVPPAVVAAGDLLVAFGFLVVFRVFKENSYASAVIEVGAEQKVIDTGPYALVRHPMYAGALLLLAATPPALGTLVALPLVAALAAVLVARIVDEERLLSAELPGYRDYCREVRHRLVPHVW